MGGAFLELGGHGRVQSPAPLLDAAEKPGGDHAAADANAHGTAQTPGKLMQ